MFWDVKRTLRGSTDSGEGGGVIGTVPEHTHVITDVSGLPTQLNQINDEIAQIQQGIPLTQEEW